MRNRLWVAAVALLAVACQEATEPPENLGLVVEQARDGSLIVTALAQGSLPDTFSAPLARALVILRRNDSVPPDTTAAPRGGAPGLASLDSIPTDTTPPPPEPVCNSGPVVATDRTNGVGQSRFRLPAGSYDLEVIPPEGRRLAHGTSCFNRVRQKERTSTTVVLLALPDSTR